MISQAQNARRLLALSFLALWAGCVAYASPAPAVNCYTRVTPHPYCEGEFVWVPGHWSLDYYGRRVWNPGHYRKRMPYM